MDSSLGNILLNSLASQVGGKIEFMDDKSFNRRITILLGLNENKLSEAEVVYNRRAELAEALGAVKQLKICIFARDMLKHMEISLR